MKRPAKIPKYRRVHRLFGLILIVITFLASVSGIILNHRSVFSSFDLPRSLLSADYSYRDGRQAALRGSVRDSNGGLLLFGDAGVWQSKNGEIVVYNQGFPSGADNRKVYDVALFKDQLVAATHFGLFTRRGDGAPWVRLDVMGSDRYVDVFFKDDSLVVLSRDAAFITVDLKSFTQLVLPPPQGYEKKTSLFRFLWNLHSGEIMGGGGKLVVDFFALVLIVLSLTGVLRFYLPRKLKNRAKSHGILLLFRRNRKLHSQLGIYCTAFLLVIIITGMFLRPPLLISIIGVDVAVIPGTHLDTPNPWHDKLRKGLWDQRAQSLVFATRDGLYSLKDQQMSRYVSQPPVSVMGCTVLRDLGESEYLVGSFAGLFLWQSIEGEVRNAITGKRYKQQPFGRPIGADMITGMVEDQGHYYIDYRRGIVPWSGEPERIILPPSFSNNARMSLWNFALEVHTGRIFESLVNVFYIFYVPLSGLLFLVVLGTGCWWYVRPKFLRKK